MQNRKNIGLRVLTWSVAICVFLLLLAAVSTFVYISVTGRIIYLSAGAPQVSIGPRLGTQKPSSPSNPPFFLSAQQGTYVDCISDDNKNITIGDIEIRFWECNSPTVQPHP